MAKRGAPRTDTASRDPRRAIFKKPKDLGDDWTRREAPQAAWIERNLMIDTLVHYVLI